MEFNVNIDKRYALAILGVLLLLGAGVVFVVAQAQSNFPNPGHSLNCFDVVDTNWASAGIIEGPLGSSTRITNLKERTGNQACQQVDAQSNCVSVIDPRDTTNLYTCDNKIPLPGTGGYWGIDDVVRCCKIGGTLP